MDGTETLRMRPFGSTVSGGAASRARGGLPLHNGIGPPSALAAEPSAARATMMRSFIFIIGRRWRRLLVAVFALVVALRQRGLPGFEFRGELPHNVGMLRGEILLLTGIGDNVIRLQLAALAVRMM